MFLRNYTFVTSGSISWWSPCVQKLTSTTAAEVKFERSQRNLLLFVCPIISDTIHFTMCTFRPSLITLTWDEKRFSSLRFCWHLVKEFKCKTTSSSKIHFFSSYQISKTMSSIHLQIRSSSVDDLQQPGRHSNWGGEVSLPAAPRDLW